MASSHAVSSRRVEWVSYSQGESKSGLAFMKAIIRGDAVHWQLRPVLDCLEPGRTGWLTQRGLPKGIGWHKLEFELSDEYPWFIESRRALQMQQRRQEADGGSTLASPDLFAEQFFCASSEGLLGMLLDGEKHRKGMKKETSIFLLEDWLQKCTPQVRLNGLQALHWQPPLDPPPCRSTERRCYPRRRVLR